MNAWHWCYRSHCIIIITGDKQSVGHGNWLMFQTTNETSEPKIWSTVQMIYRSSITNVLITMYHKKAKCYNFLQQFQRHSDSWNSQRCEGSFRLKVTSLIDHAIWATTTKNAHTISTIVSSTYHFISSDGSCCSDFWHEVSLMQLDHSNTDPYHYRKHISS